MRVFIFICLTAFLACNERHNTLDPGLITKQENRNMSAAEKEEIKSEVRALMISYQAAMDSLDAEKMVTHFKDSPDFVYTRSGRRSMYDDFRKGTKDIPNHFKKLEVYYDTVYVDVITENVAVATLSYEETLTNMKDETRDISGTIQWVALLTDGKWRFVHGHSFKDI